MNVGYIWGGSGGEAPRTFDKFWIFTLRKYDFLVLKLNFPSNVLEKLARWTKVFFGGGLTYSFFIGGGAVKPAKPLVATLMGSGGGAPRTRTIFSKSADKIIHKN